MKKALLTAAAIAAGAASFAAPAWAEKGDLLVRARAIMVAPTEDISGIEPGIPTGSVEVDDAFVPELDFTYFLSDRLALELILATSPHDLQGTGAIAGLGKVADVMVLPPTLTLQYHFVPVGKFRPYVGAGLNYTMFYNEDATTSLTGALGPTDVELDDSFGVAIQAGFDVDLNDRWFLNADVKYIQIDTEATLNSAGTINTLDVDLDPIVAGIGVGRRF